MKFTILTFCIGFILQSCWVGGGIGKSTMYGEDSWEDPIGAQVTIEAKILEISNTSSLSAGVGFSFQGSDYKEPNLEGKVLTNYIVAPILYNYKSSSGFYANGGLQPAILVTAKDKYNGQTFDYKDQMKTFDLGLVAEGGYKFNNGIGLGVRAIPGITKNHNSGNSRNLLILLRASILIDK
jgi:hypothetical protein